MTIIRLVVLVSLAATAAASACGGSSTSFGSIEEATAKLDDHRLTEGSQQIFELVGAYDGWSYIIEPGGYQVEIYIYRDRSRMSMLEPLITVRSDLVKRDNVGIMFYDVEERLIEDFMADFDN